MTIARLQPRQAGMANEESRKTCAFTTKLKLDTLALDAFRVPPLFSRAPLLAQVGDNRAGVGFEHLDVWAEGGLLPFWALAYTPQQSGS